jgi:hypothetical protein
MAMACTANAGSDNLWVLFPNPTVFDVGVFGLFDLLDEFGEAAVGSFANE